MASPQEASVAWITTSDHVDIALTALLPHKQTGQQSTSPIVWPDPNWVLKQRPQRTLPRSTREPRTPQPEPPHLQIVAGDLIPPLPHWSHRDVVPSITTILSILPSPICCVYVYWFRVPDWTTLSDLEQAKTSSRCVSLLFHSKKNRIKRRKQVEGPEKRLGAWKTRDPTPKAGSARL